MFRLGYNTNGLAHHRVLDALTLLSELGYEAVALTPDAGQLDPFELDARQVAAVRERAHALGLELAVETGARYLLDPRRKHYPSLLDPSRLARERRSDFLRRSLDLAVELDARVLSFWSGAGPQGERGDAQPEAAGSRQQVDACWDRLVEGVGALLAYARGSGIALAFEPEPGMFLERPAGYRALVQRLGLEPGELGLCLDLGHCLCTGDLPVDAVIRAQRAELAHVHLDDIRGGVHEHRMFGEGELDLRAALGALLEIGYTGMAAVELSRDSHRGASQAELALQRVRAALAPAG
jgi:L-ribulose-5-phosphate 3-epimerase